MNKVLILLGPTGVGKTAASVLLARALDTEIISADSMQIYRGMDIGTAKPSEEERALVRHHMIDIVGPCQSFSAGDYIDALIPIVTDLHSRGKIPVIAGGTGLYVKAMTQGIFSGPPADWDLREEFLAMEKNSKGSLYERLRSVDPAAAEKIDRHDVRRIIRALEVCFKTDDKMSSLQMNLTRPLPYQFIKIGLTRQRRELYGIIDHRVDMMLKEGLEDEVRRILDMNPDQTSLQAIGYKEYASYLKGEISRDEAVRLIKRNTRRYAKRQITWFKKEEGVVWIDVTGLYDEMNIYRAIRDMLLRYYPDIGRLLFMKKGSFPEHTDTDQQSMS